MSLNKCKLKAGDKVVVLVGKDTGAKGIIKSVIPSKNKVVVEGVNLITKHQKPNPHKGIEGGIVKREAPIDISNVSIFNDSTGKPDKVSYKFLETGEKIRIFRKTQETIV